MPGKLIGNNVFLNFGTNVPVLANPILGNLVNIVNPVPKIPDTPPLVTYTFANGKAQNDDGSFVAVVKNVTFGKTNATVSGWGTLTNQAQFAADSSMTISIPAKLQPMEPYGVEAVVNIPALGTGRMNIVEGQKSPFSLYVEPRNGTLCLVGSICDAKGWLSVTADKNTVPLNQWVRLAMVFTGDEIVLLINGQIAVRRVISAATLKSFGSNKMVIGVWPGGNRYQFRGQMAGLKIWNSIPFEYWPQIWHAQENGIGEIDSKYEELGGDSCILGEPTRTEAAIGKGRYRTYQRGAIYWSAGTGAWEVHGAIYSHYRAHSGPTGSLGFPNSDESVAARPGARYNRFENGAIYWSASTRAKEVHGLIFAHYLYLGAEKCHLGLPVSDEMNCANGQGRKSRFQGGNIYWSGATGAHEVHGAILSRYLKLGGPAGFLGFPISDETDILKSNNQPSGAKFSRFQGGTIYWSSASGAWEVHGAIRQLYEKSGGPLGSSKLGFPIGNETRVGGSDIKFNDFQGGVIVWRPSSGAIIFTELQLQLGKVESSSIDDGIGWFKKDRTAELITYTTVKANGVTLDNGKRRPDHHAGSDYNIGSKYLISPIRSNTAIYLKIKVDDWDYASSNDHLANYEKTFDIRTFFGQLGGSPPGVYSNQNSTSKGKDSPSLSTIRFNFSIHKPPCIDSTIPFREQCWWRFDNFKTPVLSRQMFADVFSDVENVENTWDEIMSPFDSIYYKTAYKKVAAGGNCFGISTEAVYARANQSILVEPIHDYKANSSDPINATNSNLATGLKHLFNEKHGYQVGAQAINCIIDQIMNLDIIQPLEIYNRVKYLLAVGDYPVICMNDLAHGSGHCVMPYRCDDGAGSHPHKIWIGDPNAPWRSGPADKTYIEIKKNNTFRTVNCPAPYASGTVLSGMLPSTFMSAIPYHVLRQQPRTPFWEILSTLIFLLGGILLLAGDAESEEINSDGKSYYKKVNGVRHITSNGIRGFSRVPLFDMKGKIPELYAQRGTFPNRMELKLKGTRNGDATNLIRSASNAISLNIPTKTTTRDVLTMNGLQSSRPEIRYETNEKNKQIGVNYAVLKDRANRPIRHYQLNLGVTKDEPAMLRAAQAGSGLEIKMSGTIQPIKVIMRHIENAKIVSSKFTYTPKAAGEILRIKPQDALSSASPLTIERMNTFDGKILEKKLITPKIIK